MPCHDLVLAIRFCRASCAIAESNVDGDRTGRPTVIRRILPGIDVAIQHTADGVPFLLPQTMQPAAASVATP